MIINIFESLTPVYFIYKIGSFAFWHPIRFYQDIKDIVYGIKD